MVERHVYIKLKAEHATAQGRAAAAAEIRAVFPRIPGVVAVTVGTAADEAAAASWDLALTVRFRSLGDVAGYQTHPLHTEWKTRSLQPQLEFLKAWNFAVD
jgi:stress responsive alpha/beta barrel protein